MSRSLASRLIKQAWSDIEIDGPDPLGSGSSGVVWPVVADGEKRAVKILPVQATSMIENGATITARSALDREWRRVREDADRLSSQWIVDIEDWKLVELHATEDTAAAYGLVRMERWPSNLHEYVVRGFSSRTPAQAVELVRRVAETLQGIWKEKKYLFADMKPLNFLVRDQEDGRQRVVVGDIGGLQGLTSLTSGSQVTPAWLAPECALLSEKVDLPASIYSFGLIAFFILEGHLPHAGAEVRDRFALLRKQGPDFRHGISRDLDRMVATIKKCLSHDRDLRPKNFTDVLELLHAEGGTTARMEEPAATSVEKQTRAPTGGKDETPRQAGTGSAPRARSQSPDAHVGNGSAGLRLRYMLPLAAVLGMVVVSLTPAGRDLRGLLTGQAEGPATTESKSIPSAAKPVVQTNVHLRSEPTGAQVLIDGRVVENRITPTEIAVPSERDVQITLRKDRYHDRPIHVARQVISRSATYDPGLIRLQPKFGTLRIDSVPTGARVMLNGAAVGATPFSADLDAGSYDVKAAGKERHAIFNVPLYLESEPERIVINEGGQVERNIRLAPSFGGLEIEVEPAEAEVIIDGRPIEQAILKDARFPPGKYRLEVRSPGYAPTQLELDVRVGETVRNRVVLRRDTGTLTVRTEPAGASYVIVGTEGRVAARGTTPSGIVYLPAGSYVLDLSHPGYARSSQKLDIRSGQESNVTTDTATLRRLMGIVTITSDPATTQAEVWVGGNRVGTSLPARLSFPEGRHAIEVRAVDGRLGQANFDLRDRQEIQVAVPLPRPTQPPVTAPGPSVRPASRFDGVWRARIDCKNSRSWYTFSNWQVRNDRLEAVGKNPSTQATWKLSSGDLKLGRGEIVGDVTFRDGEAARLWLDVTFSDNEIQGWGTLGSRTDCVVSGSRISR